MFVTIETFIFNHIEIYETGVISVESGFTKRSNTQPANNKTPVRKSLIVQQLNKSSLNKCPICERNHKIYGCD